MNHAQYCLTALLLLVCSTVLAQNLDSTAHSATTKSVVASQAASTLNASRLDINKTAMLTLGGWAAANMLANGLAMTRSAGSAYYFQQMNVLWNVVNLGLATAGYLGSVNEIPAAYSLYESLNKQAAIESILLLNAGLDVAYMAGGLWLLERSAHDASPATAERWRGYGQSLLLQGAFLLVFDVAVYCIQHLTNQPLIQTLLNAVQLGANAAGGVQFGLALHF
jgi:hypothetical protein